MEIASIGVIYSPFQTKEACPIQGEVILSRPTFLDDENHGVFASRHPCRPNGIGMSIVRLDGRNGNILEISGIDVLDQTPLIDIKPYAPHFDHFEGAGNGWVGDVIDRPKQGSRVISAE